MKEVEELAEILGTQDAKKAASLLKQIEDKITHLTGENQKLKDYLTGVVNSVQKIVAHDKGDNGADDIAEHQRACEQYVYRDRLLVQEFYFAIVVIGLAGNLVKTNLFSVGTIVTAVLTSGILFVLWRHIDHLRIDRDLMWTRAKELEPKVKMEVMSKIWERSYSEEAKKEKKNRRISGTKWMVRAVGAFSLLWFLLAVGVSASFTDSINDWVSRIDRGQSGMGMFEQFPRQ